MNRVQVKTEEYGRLTCTVDIDDGTVHWDDDRAGGIPQGALACMESLVWRFLDTGFQFGAFYCQGRRHFATVERAIEEVAHG